MSTFGDIVLAIVAAIVRAFAETYAADARDQRATTTARARGAAEAGNETLATIGATADAQAALASAPDDPAALSRRLRARAGALAAGTGPAEPARGR